MGERPSHHAHFDVQILVVSNAAGHDKYFNPQAWDTLEHALQAHGRHADGKSWELQLRRPTARTLAGPVSLHQLFTSKAPEEPHSDPPQLALPALPAASAITRSMQWDNNEIIYTDGSAAKDGSAGAGLATLPPAASTAPILTVKVRLRGTNSSLGAELVGLAYGLRLTPHQPIIAATDCSVAMSLVRKGLEDSTSMIGHKEEKHIRAVMRAIKARTAKATIIKVKGHVGITGNVEADKAANEARLLPEPDSSEDDDNSGSDDEDAGPKVRLLFKDGSECTKVATTAKLQELQINEVKKTGTRARVKNKNNALSTAELWLEAIEREKLIPLSDPAFNKVRLLAKARKTMFRRRIFEWSPRNGQACMLPGCTATVPSLLHACGGCNNTEIKAIGTSGSNQAVQTYLVHYDDDNLVHYDDDNLVH